MADLTDWPELNKKFLADVFKHGGSIMFDRVAVGKGYVHDVTPGFWYSIEYRNGRYCFIDNAGEENIAGAPGSVLYRRDPMLARTCPF